MMLLFDEVEVITLYRSPADAGRAYRDHAEALTCLVRAQDYSRFAVAGCQLGAPSDGSAWQIAVMDAKRDLERVFYAAQAALEDAREWWVWWAVRVEGRTLRELPDVARSTADRIVKRVDRVVRAALDERQLLARSVSEEEDARINSLDTRRVRTCLIVYGDEGER